MKRALLITNIFPPLIGGPATFIDRAAHRLAEDGVEVTVVCSSIETQDPSDLNRPFRVIRIPLRNRVRYEVYLRLTLWRQILRHKNILVNGLENYVWPIARFCRRPYVLKIVGDTVWETARNQGRTCLNIDDFQQDRDAQNVWRSNIQSRNGYVHGAAKVITPSEYLRQMVIGWGVPAHRVVVIRNGVELADAGCAPVVKRAPGETFKVIFVGRLTNWKGVETLLLAVKDLPRVDVQVVGDGPEWPQLVDLKNQLCLGDRVHFTGRMDARKIHAEMKTSHVLVLTSLYEGLSHTLLEAVRVGLPCIASDCGGNNEVIEHGKNGLLIRPQDVDGLREALLRLEQNEGLRQRLAANAHEASMSFDLRHTVDRYREELTKVTA